MLVLSRKPGESVVIGDVKVYVSGIRGNKVRIAIDAPDDVVILRGELASNAMQWIDEPNDPHGSELQTVHVADNGRWG